MVVLVPQAQAEEEVVPHAQAQAEEQPQAEGEVEAVVPVRLLQTVQPAVCAEAQAAAQQQQPLYFCHNYTFY